MTALWILIFELNNPYQTAGTAKTSRQPATLGIKRLTRQLELTNDEVGRSGHVFKFPCPEWVSARLCHAHQLYSWLVFHGRTWVVPARRSRLLQVQLPIFAGLQADA